MRRVRRPPVAAPNATAEADFERELEVFRREAGEASQFLYGFLGVHAVVGESSDVYRLLNTAPLLWNTILGGLQTAGIVVLGRVFDQSSAHNVDRLLSLASKNPTIFSKAALGARKRGASPGRHQWLASYLQTAYVPTSDDFRRLRKHVNKHRRVYEANYRDLRHSVFAHKGVSDPAAVQALFAKTNVRELQKIVVFLGALHECLLQLFVNGRKPVLRPARYSLRRMLAKPSPHWTSQAVQERLVGEVQRFLRACASSI